MLINSIKHQVYTYVLTQITLFNLFQCVDREAITEYEVKVKELRKQVDDMVRKI